MDHVIVKDGKPVFIGSEDSHNPPVPVPQECNHGEDCSHMQCLYCQKYVDYLVGDDENGGRRGCESCWMPPKKGNNEKPNEEEGVVFE